MKRKITAVLAATAMLTAAAALPVQAEGNWYDNDGTVKWRIEDGILTVAPGEKTVMPDYSYPQWDNYEENGPAWRTKMESVTEIRIEPGVESIGENAFHGYIERGLSEYHYFAPNVTKVYIPGTVTDIGSCSFVCLDKLTDLQMENGVERIGGSAFSRCTSLETLTMPNSLVELEGGAFSNCTGLKTINWSAGLENTGYNTFFMCTGLEKVEFPSTMRVISERSFNRCTNLSSIEFEVYEKSKFMPGEGVEGIESVAFCLCNGLKEVTFPSTLKRIEYGAFYSCENLERIEFGRNLEYIGEDAFSNCPALNCVIVRSPDCQFADTPSIFTNKTEYDPDADHPIITDCTYTGAIVGFTGSTAEAYAKKYNYTFVSYGSINDEPEINASDAAAILVVSAKIGGGGDSGLTAVQLAAADVNGDEAVNATDAAIILQYAAAVGAGQKNISLADFVRT